MHRMLTIVMALSLAAPALAVDQGRLAMARTQAVKGEKALAKARYDAAEKLFRKAIDAEPSYPASYLGLGAALSGQRRFAEAIPVLEEAKDRYVRWEQEAQATEMQARQDAAARAREFRDLQQQQALHGPPTSGGQAPGSPTTAMAASRVASEEYLSRRGWKVENLQAIPAQAFYLEGLAYLRTGERDKGIDELETCLALDAKHGLASYNLAVALFSRGEAVLAKDYLDQAVANGVKPNPRFVSDLEAAAKAAGAKQ